MKKFLLVAAALAVALSSAPRAEAKVAALYASGMGGFQSTNTTGPGVGLMLGARLFLLDGYADYTVFGAGESVSRGILGLLGGFGQKDFRLVLRGGLGGIHETNGALTGPTGAPGRMGAVARAGVALETRINWLTYLGFAVDGETYLFPTNDLGRPTRGSDILGTTTPGARWPERKGKGAGG
ncbi:MAG: hypothetical protein FJ090_21650 [Deltaproteobacteria bacterium]|nr:hypothetical protein [Deltaproteobacteria bacterium]